MVYWPLMMDHFAGQEHKLQRATVFVVRSRTAGTQPLWENIEQKVADVTPNVPLTNNKTLGDLYAKSMARTTFTLVMLCVFAGMALTLGTLGIFGAIAYSIAQRSRRLVPLITPQRSILEASIRQGISLTLPGIAIGLVVAYIVMRFMPTLLYGVSPHDPLTYITTTWAVLSAALVGCYLPARRVSVGSGGRL